MAFLSKYATARHIYVPVIKRGVVDFAVSADWTPAAGDVKISKDGGAAANVTNLPSAITMGNTAMWDFSLTSTEMTAAQICVTVADSSTKAVEDTQFDIETYGNASAEHIFDLGTAMSGQAVSSVSGAVGSVTGNVGGNVVGSVASVTAAVSVTGDFTSTMKTSIGTAVAASAVASVTGNVGGNVVGSVGSVTGLTASNLDTTVSSRLASSSYTAPDNADIGTILTDVVAIKAKTDNLPASPASAGNVSALLTTQLTESYAADGAAPTLTQALMAIQQFLQERGVSGTTLTVNKLDGSTAAMTFTLNDGTSPTSITRAT